MADWGRRCKRPGAFPRHPPAAVPHIPLVPPPRHAAAACRNGLPQDRVRQWAAWTGRAERGRLTPPGVSGALVSGRLVGKTGERYGYVANGAVLSQKIYARKSVCYHSCQPRDDLYLDELILPCYQRAVRIASSILLGEVSTLQRFNFVKASNPRW